MKKRVLLLKKKILFIYFLGQEEGREKERERSIDVGEEHQLVASHRLPNWDRTHNHARDLTGRPQAGGLSPNRTTDTQPTGSNGSGQIKLYF